MLLANGLNTQLGIKSAEKMSPDVTNMSSSDPKQKNSGHGCSIETEENIKKIMLIAQKMTDLEKNVEKLESKSQYSKFPQNISSNKSTKLPYSERSDHKYCNLILFNPPQITVLPKKNPGTFFVVNLMNVDDNSPKNSEGNNASKNDQKQHLQNSGKIESKETQESVDKKASVNKQSASVTEAKNEGEISKSQLKDWHDHNAVKSHQSEKPLRSLSYTRTKSAEEIKSQEEKDGADKGDEDETEGEGKDKTKSKTEKHLLSPKSKKTEEGNDVSKEVDSSDDESKGKYIETTKPEIKKNSTDTEGKHIKKEKNRKEKEDNDETNGDEGKSNGEVQDKIKSKEKEKSFDTKGKQTKERKDGEKEDDETNGDEGKDETKSETKKKSSAANGKKENQSKEGNDKGEDEESKHQGNNRSNDHNKNKPKNESNNKKASKNEDKKDGDNEDNDDDDDEEVSSISESDSEDEEDNKCQVKSSDQKGKRKCCLCAEKIKSRDKYIEEKNRRKSGKNKKSSKIKDDDGDYDDDDDDDNESGEFESKTFAKSSESRIYDNSKESNGYRKSKKRKKKSTFKNSSNEISDADKKSIMQELQKQGKDLKEIKDMWSAYRNELRG